MFRIIQGDFTDPRVVDLLRTHLTSARAETAPDSAHALDLTGLQSPDIHFWTIWEDGRLLGCGALKRLSADHGEIKSMHAAQNMRRKGVGTAMLRHIIAAARAQGMLRLSLETGAWDYFKPARDFYKRHGFEERPPFANHVPDPNSIFMTLDLPKALPAKYTLRTATEEDQEFCFRLNEACFRTQIEMIRGWDEARERADSAAQFRPGVDFIIVTGDEPVGHFALDEHADRTELRMLALAPSIQGKGIGTSLLQKAIERAKSRRVPLVLWVADWNVRAIKLYSKLGFKVVDVVWRADKKVHKLRMSAEA